QRTLVVAFPPGRAQPPPERIPFRSHVAQLRLARQRALRLQSIELGAERCALQHARIGGRASALLLLRELFEAADMGFDQTPGGHRERLDGLAREVAEPELRAARRRTAVERRELPPPLRDLVVDRPETTC